MITNLPVRQGILTFLGHSHVLSAQELVSKLKTQRPTINKTTVYRALDQLEAGGFVCRHHFIEKESVYELRNHHHDHLFCTSCGKVFETPCIGATYPKTIHGFCVDHHHVTLYGTCNDCSKQ